MALRRHVILWFLRDEWYVCKRVRTVPDFKGLLKIDSRSRAHKWSMIRHPGKPILISQSMEVRGILRCQTRTVSAWDSAPSLLSLVRQIRRDLSVGTQRGEGAAFQADCGIVDVERCGYALAQLAGGGEATWKSKISHLQIERDQRAGPLVRP
ncbi:hypothetical protein BP00DRAFT_227887 [Aspergillus indologenus CBS 114.80]|uniref:Uncharacterized protein n=1 Tax=Aspergillus indologenus CBS 114.80 TaxID=1450541 RepID=A0A2V5IZ53_9EURO|nr:hypothetical protein BP00DRAFT_227887 [Aspergillus indologenus CBS 114.80]